MEQAREEELCCPSQTGPDPAQDVPISQIQIARRNSSSNNADASPEPTVEDNAGIAARPGDDDIEAGGIAESMVVDGSGNSEESGNPASVGVSATGTANSGGSTEENLDVLLVEAEAQCKAAEEALKGLRDTLKREKRKDEKAMADAEKKRNKMKDENGNLPNGKKRVLLVHCDEKWFWGLVLRAFAKACEEIGVKKRDYAAFHRSHINKVMAIAFVAAVFDGSLESGCEVVKLPLVRAQAPKIAERALSTKQHHSLMVQHGTQIPTPMGHQRNLFAGKESRFLLIVALLDRTKAPKRIRNALCSSYSRRLFSQRFSTLSVRASNTKIAMLLSRATRPGLTRTEPSRNLLLTSVLSKAGRGSHRHRRCLTPTSLT